MSLGFDVSGFTALSVKFTKPSGAILTVTDPAVTVPNFDTNTTLGLFPANKYVSYTFQLGDVNECGEWSVRLTYDDPAPEHLISDVAKFTVYQ